MIQALRSPQSEQLSVGVILFVRSTPQRAERGPLLLCTVAAFNTSTWPLSPSPHLTFPLSPSLRLASLVAVAHKASVTALAVAVDTRGPSERGGFEIALAPTPADPPPRATVPREREGGRANRRR